MQTILGNFAFILFILTIVTGAIWFFDVFYLAKQRRLKTDQALAELQQRYGAAPSAAARAEIETAYLKQPGWIEYSGGFFPVIALVFFLRSFLYEPFKIPSSSMVPTLQIGDLILVNKFVYGIRLPVLNKKIIEIDQPQRGDVMVFRYPKDPSLDYIKRVVGVPGDKISYVDKRLTVNGKEVAYEKLSDYLDEDKMTYSEQYIEHLPTPTNTTHRILNDSRAPASVSIANVDLFPHHELCNYDANGFNCTVPKDQYFMMGDNRDNSQDSRYWGFVPNENIVGKAFFIWMNLNNFPANLKRIGSFR